MTLFGIGVFYYIGNFFKISYIIKRSAEDAHNVHEKGALQPHIGAKSVQVPHECGIKEDEVDLSTLFQKKLRFLCTKNKEFFGLFTEFAIYLTNTFTFIYLVV